MVSFSTPGTGEAVLALATLASNDAANNTVTRYFMMSPFVNEANGTFNLALFAFFHFHGSINAPTQIHVSRFVPPPTSPGWRDSHQPASGNPGTVQRITAYVGLKRAMITIVAKEMWARSANSLKLRTGTQ